MSEDIKIFKNLSDEVIKFDTTEEFDRYYHKNKDTVDKMPTRGLNTKFKISGYRIGRLRGKITLFPIKNKNAGLVETLDESSDQPSISEKLNILNGRLKNVEALLDELLSYVVSEQ